MLSTIDEGEFPVVVGTFLEQDVQNSIKGCQGLLADVEAVEQGRLPESSGTGNAHAIMIRPCGVTIECIWDENLAKAELSLDEFKQCLKAWLECISSPIRQQL